MENSFEKLLVSLVNARVDFVLVGGLAVALNGFVRATEDVDILVSRDPENLRRMLDCLSGFGEGHARELTAADFTDEEGAVRIYEDFPLDIFTRIGGFRLDDLRAHIAHEKVGDVAVPYLNVTGLVTLKSGSHREKDHLDVLALQRILREKPGKSSDQASP